MNKKNKRKQNAHHAEAMAKNIVYPGITPKKVSPTPHPRGLRTVFRFSTEKGSIQFAQTPIKVFNS